MVSDQKFLDINLGTEVLILVLMEDGLGRYVTMLVGTIRRLNPCFNGRWSRTQQITIFLIHLICLNPCFNGRWSRTYQVFKMQRIAGLNPCFNGRWSRTENNSLYATEAKS